MRLFGERGKIILDKSAEAIVKIQKIVNDFNEKYSWWKGLKDLETDIESLSAPQR